MEYDNINIFFRGPELDGVTKITDEINKLMNGDEFGYDRLEVDVNFDESEVWGAIDGINPSYCNEIVNHFSTVAQANPARNIVVIGDCGEEDENGTIYGVLFNQGYDDNEVKNLI